MECSLIFVAVLSSTAHPTEIPVFDPSVYIISGAVSSCFMCFKNISGQDGVLVLSLSFCRRRSIFGWERVQGGVSFRSSRIFSPRISSIVALDLIASGFGVLGRAIKRSIEVQLKT